MNRDEIMNMQPGRELDKLVGNRIFGLEVKEFPAGYLHYIVNHGWHQVKPYSTDISAAWEVVEKLRDENCKIVLEASLIKGWYVNVKNEFGGNITGIYEFETAPEAICMSALLTLIQEDTP